MSERVRTNGESTATLDRRSDHRKNKCPLIYFLAIPDPVVPRLKIGFSSDWRKRKADHKNSHLGARIEFRELCLVRGGRNDEKAVHRYFSEFLVEGEKEVFHPNDLLVGYIRWLRNQYFVHVTDDHLCQPVDELPEMDFSAWCPAPDRIVTLPAPEPDTIPFPQDDDPFIFPRREITGDDFYTSSEILDVAREAMGGVIDIDPASHPTANQVVRATSFFTKADDGLGREWSGSVWLNPPFSQWQLWAPKVIDEWKSGRVRQMCVLAATRTLTAKYFSCIHENCRALCVLNGRIPFWGPKATTSPDDGHAVFYFGDQEERFIAAFSRIGNTYRR